MLARATRSVAMAARARAMSSAPAVAVDWDALRTKMLDDDSRAAFDAARNSFDKRMRAATSVTSVPGIDWDHYKQALPDVDIDALRQEYDSFIGCVPNVPYIAEADAAKAAADKATFEGVSAYAQSRTSELAELAAEQEDHKLHEYYTVARLFQRFDGLYEKEWLEWRKVNLLGNLRSLSEASDTITDQQKHQVAASMADKMGVDASQFSRSA